VPIYDIFDGIDRFFEPHAASTLVRFDGGDPPSLASSPEAGKRAHENLISRTGRTGKIVRNAVGGRKHQ
ncbi:hypothetical protein ACCS72_37590, partial [Rhizobium ruizarguesonis]